MSFELLLVDDDIPQQKLRIIRIVNILSIATAFTVFILGPYLYFITGYHSILFPALIEGTLFLIVPYLNSKGQHKMAIRLMFSVHAAAVAYFTLILGPSSNVLAFAVFLCVAAFTIFADKKSLIVAIIIIIAMTAGVQASHSHHFITILPLTPAALQNLDWTVDISVLVLTASILHAHEYEKKQNEKEKALLMGKLDRANHAKSVYVRETTHEMRTPLNLIYSVVQDYESKKNYSSKTVNLSFQDYENLQFGCQSLQTVINNTLIWSRIETGQQEEINPTPFNIRKWIEEEAQSYWILGKEKEIKIISNAGNLPHTILIDHPKLMKILVNLLGNSIKFTANKSIVTIDGFVNEDGLLIFRVSDQGPGIPEDMMDKIFEPFNSEANQKIESTGLGLPIAKQMARILGGDIYVRNNADSGATFTVALPMVVSDITDLKEELVKEDEKFEEGCLEGYKVLVIDDSEMTVMYAKRIIERMGAEVMTFEKDSKAIVDAEIALEEIIKHQPDVILLDLHMPGLSGGLLMLQIMCEPTTLHIPIVIMSGDFWSKEHLLDQGAAAFVEKPVVYRRLQRTLKDILLKNNSIKQIAN